MEKMFGVVLVFVLVACGGNQAAAQTPEKQSNGPGSSTTSPTSGETGTEDMSELETKRQVERIQAKFPEQKTKFKELCGSDVSLEVDWASFGRDKSAYESLASNYGVDRLIESFRGLCKDKVGKDAVKAKIHAIRAVNVRDKEKIKVTVASGTVTAMLNWSGGFSPGRNESEIAAEIMKAL